MSKTDVTLREITADTLGPVLRLETAGHQGKFVAPNSVSIAQAHFSDQAWFRAIYANETPVGFVMLDLDVVKPEYWVWRFMIDQAHQGKGYGREAIIQVIEHVRNLPRAITLRLSYVPGEGNPSPFYRKVGFIDTGEEEEGEKLMELALQ
jgi:diamine N-acetyltransferase